MVVLGGLVWDGAGGGGGGLFVAALSSGAWRLVVVVMPWAWGSPFFPFPMLVFLVFFEITSSSGYSSKRALLPDRLDPSGRPPS